MKKYFYYLVLLLLSATLHSQKPEISESAKMRVAACQFPVSDNIKENAVWIMDQMLEARDSGAHVVHFPECALSGYPGVDMESLEGKLSSEDPPEHPRYSDRKSL